MVGRSPAQAIAITLLNPPTRLMLGGMFGQNRHIQRLPWDGPTPYEELERAAVEELGQEYQVFQGKAVPVVPFSMAVPRVRDLRCRREQVFCSASSWPGAKGPV